jgi:nucleotide-binding universal stress UspA family protein
MYERIVVGTDGSKTARVASDRAANLAGKLGASMVLVHAGPGFEGFEKLADEYGAEAVTRRGSAAEALISEAEKNGSNLLVVGSVGMSGRRKWSLGNVPNKVSHHAPTDVLIVKTDPPPKEVGDYRRILIGTDGSPTAMRALDVGATLSKKLGAEALVVCAYEPPTKQELDSLKSDPNDPVAQWDQEQIVRETPDEFRWRIAGAAQAEDVLERAADRVSDRGVEAEVKALKGPADEVLVSVAESEDAELIVVGSVGMSGGKRFILGNVPNRISHQAPTDVLILKTE